MIFIIYLVLAVGVIYFSVKASIYVDLLDKKTSLSGAFIGGVMLSAVTSLPELFTSVSAIVFLKNPGMGLGNILGSNLFNTMILALLILIFIKDFAKIKVGKSHYSTIEALGIAYLGLFFISIGFNFSILNIEWISILFVVVYIFALKKMMKDTPGIDEIQEKIGKHEKTELNNTIIESKLSELSVKQIGMRFIFVSIMIVVVSIAITFATSKIATILNLKAGLAGALLLGIATSLPEVSSTFSLFKIKNFNIGIGNIIGSNLFNLTILTIVDIIYFGKNLYDFGDNQVEALMKYGLLSLPILVIVFKIKNKYIKCIGAITILGMYLAFLLV